MDEIVRMLEGPITKVFPSLTDACIGFGVAVFAVLIFLALHSGASLHKFREEEKIKEKKRLHDEGAGGSENKSEFMDQLSKMVTDILENESDKEISTAARNKIKGSALPMSYRIKKMLKDMMTNPYNPIALPKMILASITFAIVGLGLGVFLKNFVFCVMLTVVGLIAPIIFVSVTSLNNQVSVLQGNLGLISSHLGIYKESNSVADSFRALLNVLTPNTREYKAVYRAHGGLVEANLDLYTVIERLKQELLVDAIVGQYFDVCYICDTKSSEYKDALDYLPTRLEPIVLMNIKYAATIKIGFMAYIISAGIIVFTMFYYNYAEPDIYEYFSASIPGQAISFGLMSIFVLFGIIYTKLSHLILLE